MALKQCCLGHRASTILWPLSITNYRGKVFLQAHRLLLDLPFAQDHAKITTPTKEPGTCLFHELTSFPFSLFHAVTVFICKGLESWSVAFFCSHSLEIFIVAVGKYTTMKLWCSENLEYLTEFNIKDLLQFQGVLNEPLINMDSIFTFEIDIKYPSYTSHWTTKLGYTQGTHSLIREILL